MKKLLVRVGRSASSPISIKLVYIVDQLENGSFYVDMSGKVGNASNKFLLDIPAGLQVIPEIEAVTK